MHDNLRLTDASGRRLIYADSDFARSVLREYALTQYREMGRQLRRLLAIDAEEVLSISDLLRVFASTLRHPSLDLDEAEEEVAAAVREFRDQVAEVYAYVARSFTDDEEEIGLEAEPDEHIGEDAGAEPRAYASFQRAMVSLLYVLTVRLKKATIPFVILDEPLASASSDTGSSYAMVRHDIVLDFDYNPRDQAYKPTTTLFRRMSITEEPPSDDHDEMPGNRATGLAEDYTTQHDFGESLLQQVFLGKQTYHLEFPIHEDAQSYHMCVSLSRGASVKTDLVAFNFDNDVFRDDNRGGRFSCYRQGGIRAYRTAERIRLYGSQARVNAAADYRDRLWLRLQIGETPGVRETFYAGVVSASMAGVVMAADDALGQNALQAFIAALTILLVLVVQSTDRPFSARLLRPRLYAIAGAWVLGWLATRLVSDWLSA